jgi:hypothetical protein
VIDAYLSADDTPLSQAIRTQRPLWIESFEAYQQLFPELAAQVSNPSDHRALVCLPMIVHNRAIGGISMRFRYQQHWSDERQACRTVRSGDGTPPIASSGASCSSGSRTASYRL